MPEQMPDPPPGSTPVWSLEEARSYLPRLRTLLAIVRRAADLALLARGNGHSKLDDSPLPSAGSAVGGSTEDEIGAGEDRPSGLSPRQALGEISSRGIILRDSSRALVDFPSRGPSGSVVLLCWQEGEDDIEWWHLPEDGFAGRRPLPVPPDV